LCSIGVYSFIVLIFCYCRETVRDTIQEVFAGPADTGVFSASVQQSLYLTQKAILEKIPQVSG
jgi:urate oxidase